MLGNPSTDSDNHPRVWKYVLVGVIALVGVVVVVDATLTSNRNNGNNGLDRRSALQGKIGDLMGDSESLEVAADTYTTYFVTRRGDFTTVKEICEAHGGKLASPMSKAETEQVVAACGGQFWCYIPQVTQTQCVAISAWDGWTKTHSHCSRPLSGVCERHRAPGQRYFLTNQEDTFDRVRKQCQDKGGDLASLKSLADVVDSQGLCDGKHSCYIGLTDRENQTHWKWVDRSQNTYRNWAPGEPNNIGHRRGPGEHCVEMSTLGGRWNDVPCYKSLYGICEHKKSH